MRIVSLACGETPGVWVLGDSSVRRFDAEGQGVADFELDRLPWSIGLDEANDSIWVGFDGEAACYSPAGQRIGGFRDAPRLGRATAIERVGESIVVGDATGRCLRLYDLDGRWIRDIGNANRTQGLLIPNGVVDFDVDRRSSTLVVANPAKRTSPWRRTAASRSRKRLRLA
ncbi:MAG: hypothetical protein DCC67_05195 [Planctomycetota bacterium]|nr:MAG: hypothetical protein DCC67_05195 [Planctomycetota bacterium]